MMTRLGDEPPRDGEEFASPHPPKTWSWSREQSWTRCGQRIGACGVKPGIMRLWNASGQTQAKAVPSVARHLRTRGELASERVRPPLPGQNLGRARSPAATTPERRPRAGRECLLVDGRLADELHMAELFRVPNRDPFRVTG
jgi:hypothetical protein